MWPDCGRSKLQEPKKPIRRPADPDKNCRLMGRLICHGATQVRLFGVANLECAHCFDRHEIGRANLIDDAESAGYADLAFQGHGGYDLFKLFRLRYLGFLGNPQRESNEPFYRPVELFLWPSMHHLPTFGGG